MTVSVEGGGKSRRKDVDADLNLVPYIDLLTCMVAFLLITAVWSQLARLSVAQKGQGEESDVVIEKAPRIDVLVHGDGFSLVTDDAQKFVPKRGAGLDYPALVAELRQIKERHPDAIEARILAQDGIVFDEIVHTMDTAMTAGFPDLSLLDDGS